jgi:hypothetical protein
MHSVGIGGPTVVLSCAAAKPCARFVLESADLRIVAPQIGNFADLTTPIGPGYAASMNNAAMNPPVVELPDTSGSASASWISSFYYWFTNPPASLAGQFG